MDQGKAFSEYKFSEQINTAISALGFQHATPVQDRAIPIIASGQDIAGLAQTGTGKTAAFLLPLIERVLRSKSEKTGDEEIDARAFTDWQSTHFNLVLVPTRELAEQVKDCALDFLKDTDLRVVAVYGGVSIDKQIEQLNKGFTFLIATPGRLIDLYKEHKVDLKQVRSVTFDEADRMFDMGFKDDMKYILRRIPETRQFLLFSATLNLEVFNVAYQFGANPVEIKVSQDQVTADNVEDWIFHLGGAEKPSHLLGVIEKYKPQQVIIFTNFKSNVERIAEFLNKNGHKAVGISSLLTQAQRKRVMTRFRSEDGENILVATDVAARGLDIQGVDMVINFELPDDAENYVHRIGRTGRAGEKGRAYSFVSDKDVEALDRIKAYLKRAIDTEWLDDGELPKEYQAFPRGELIMKSRPRNGDRNGKRMASDRRPERGERDRNRRPRDGDRNRDRDRDKFRDKNRPDRKRHAAQAEGEEPRRDERPPRSEERVHRDKRSGRHKQGEGRNQERKPQRSANAKGRYKGKRDEKHGERDQSKRQSSTPAKQTSVLGRLKKAVAGLFK